MSEKLLNDELIDGWWDVARAGKWRGSTEDAPLVVELTAEDLERMAADYDPKLQEAPVTIEHRHDGPALGWVAALRVSGGVLQARLHRLSNRLRQWLREGAYRSRSIEMYKPFEPTGSAYLAAVSFLGAQPPAVKGLSPEPSLLAEGLGELHCLTETDCHSQPHALGGYEMDRKHKGLAARAVSSLKEVFAGDEAAIEQTTDVAELQAKLEQEHGLRIAAEKRVAELERKLAELEEKLAALENEEEMEEYTAALAEAASQQRITPAEHAGYIRLGERLDRAGREELLAELSSRQPLGMFAELSATRKLDSGAELARTRAAFNGFPDDPEHDDALKLMAAEPGLKFEEAIRRVRLAGAPR
jgi:hypothetical protein